MLVSPGFSARSQQWLMVPMCRGRRSGRRGTSDSSNSGQGEADTASCPAASCSALPTDSVWSCISPRTYCIWADTAWSQSSCYLRLEEFLKISGYIWIFMDEETMKLQKHLMIFFVNHLDNRYRNRNFIRTVWVWFDCFDYQTMQCHQ